MTREWRRGPRRGRAAPAAGPGAGKRAGSKAGRALREQLARERRRRRTLWTSLVAAAALLVAGLVGWGIYTAQRAGDYRTPLVAAGQVRLVHHPVAILDRFSTTGYSTRASAASGCAADGGKFREYAEALFANQPPEGGAGLTDDRLVEIGRSVGLGDEFGSCVRDGTYRTWTRHVTEAGSEDGVNSTPTVLVAGRELRDRSPGGLTAAVQAADR